MPPLISTFVRLYGCLFFLLFSTPALAEPAADFALRDPQRTYQSGPTCERVGIEVRTPRPVTIAPNLRVPPLNRAIAEVLAAL